MMNFAQLEDFFDIFLLIILILWNHFVSFAGSDQLLVGLSEGSDHHKIVLLMLLLIRVRGV